MGDISDFTYIRNGEIRISFSIMREYGVDNRMVARKLGKIVARKASRNLSRQWPHVDA
jgi:hypothetical protein